jgi:hypothetical protein
MHQREFEENGGGSPENCYEIKHSLMQRVFEEKAEKLIWIFIH